MKRVFTLSHQPARRRAMEAVANAPDGYVITVAEPTRSTDQNAKLWAVLTEISDHVVWHGQKLSPTNWKDMFSATLKKQEAVPGIDGGFVILGQATSRMSKREFSDLLELAQAFGASKGVVFNEPAEA